MNIVFRAYVSAVFIACTTMVGKGQGFAKPAPPVAPNQIQVTCSVPPSPNSSIPTAWNALSLIIACGSLYLVLKGLRISEKNLRAKIAWDAFALLEGKDGETRKQRHLLDQLLKKARSCEREFNILDEDPGDREKLDELARAYDMAGHLVKHRLISVDLLFDFYSRPIAQAWQYLAPMINEKRNEEDSTQPGHMKQHMRQFEILAAGAVLYRKEKYPGESPFDISSEAKLIWREWAKNGLMK